MKKGNTCRGCSVPCRDAYLCTDCVDLVLADLIGVDGQVNDLLISLCRWAKITSNNTGIRTRDAETPLPVDLKAGEALWALREVLGSWARMFAHSHKSPLALTPEKNRTIPQDRARVLFPRGEVGLFAVWLIDHIDWVRMSKHAGQFMSELGREVKRVRSLVDRPPDRVYGGPCDVCGKDLYHPPHAVSMECELCGREFDVYERVEWLLLQAEDYLVTAVEASKALPGLVGRPITTSMIRGLAFRGRLAQHSPDPRVGLDAKGNKQYLYRIGEVLDVLREDDEAAAAKEKKRDRHREAAGSGGDSEGRPGKAVRAAG